MLSVFSVYLFAKLFEHPSYTITKPYIHNKHIAIVRPSALLLFSRTIQTH